MFVSALIPFSGSDLAGGVSLKRFRNGGKGGGDLNFVFSEPITKGYNCQLQGV